MLSREERAKQFLSFDALSGFTQKLKEKEKEHERSVEDIEIRSGAQCAPYSKFVTANNIRHKKIRSGE